LAVGVNWILCCILIYENAINPQPDGGTIITDESNHLFRSHMSSAFLADFFTHAHQHKASKTHSPASFPEYMNWQPNPLVHTFISAQSNLMGLIVNGQVIIINIHKRNDTTGIHIRTPTTSPQSKLGVRLHVHKHIHTSTYTLKHRL